MIPNDPYNVVSSGNYLDWRRDTQTMKEIAATNNASFNVASEGGSFTPEYVVGAACSANLFRTLGVSPILGGGFLESEDRQNAPYVAVISYRLWQQRFEGAPDVTHRQIRLDENNYSIVGVMPKGF